MDISTVYTRKEFENDLEYWKPHAVIKITDKYVVTKQFPFDRKTMRLDRGALEASGEVWHREAGEHFVLQPPPGAVVGVEAARAEAARLRAEREEYQATPEGKAAAAAHRARVTAYLSGATEEECRLAGEQANEEGQ